MDELKLFRLSLNFTSKKMSDEIGISKSFYEKIETGYRKPSSNFTKKFKKRFPQFDVNNFFKH